MVAIVPDAASMDRPGIEVQMRDWLRQDYFDRAYEWGYLKLPRRLLAEAMLKGPEGDAAPEVQVMTFHGQAVVMRVLTGRKGRETRHANWFDTEGEELSLKSRDIPVGTYRMAPEVARMLSETAGRAASGFDHLRVDFYLTDAGPKIGELTAYHASAIVEWNDLRFNEVLGRCWSDPAEAAPSSSRQALESLRRHMRAADVAELHQAMGESGDHEIAPSNATRIVLR